MIVFLYPPLLPCSFFTFPVVSEGNNNLFYFSLQAWHLHNLICTVLGEEAYCWMLLLLLPLAKSFGHHSC